MSKKKSIIVNDTIKHMQEGKGTIAMEIYFALSTAPLQYRTFGGNQNTEGDLSDETMDEKFGGSYLMTMITAAITLRFLSEESHITFYMDGMLSRFLKRHGLLDCGLWDRVDDTTLDEHLNVENTDFRWAYSACKPIAMKDMLSKTNKPCLFHDTDMILFKAPDRILGIDKTGSVPVAFAHFEEIGRPFYPPFNELQLPLRYAMEENKLVDEETGYHYRTDLRAVNTALIYHEDKEAAYEIADLFGGLMHNNKLDEYDWIKGEAHLLAFDQRPGLMVVDRKNITCQTFLPFSWDSINGHFIDIDTGNSSSIEWHYYKPGYLAKRDDGTFHDIQHLWIQKADIEKHTSYNNYVMLFDLQLIKELCPLCGLNWEALLDGLSTLNSLSEPIGLLKTGKTIEELLAVEKRKPVECRIIDDILIKGLQKVLIPEREKVQKE